MTDILWFSLGWVIGWVIVFVIASVSVRSMK